MQHFIINHFILSNYCLIQIFNIESKDIFAHVTTFLGLTSSVSSSFAMQYFLIYYHLFTIHYEKLTLIQRYTTLRKEQNVAVIQLASHTFPVHAIIEGLSQASILYPVSKDANECGNVGVDVVPTEKNIS